MKLRIADCGLIDYGKIEKGRVAKRSRTAKSTKAQRISLICNLHPGREIPVNLKSWLFLALLVLVLPTPAFGDNYQRQTDIDILKYTIDLEWAENIGEAFGSVTIEALIRGEEVPGIWLDFTGTRVLSVSAGGIERPYTWSDGRLSFSLDRKYGRGETVRVQVRYSCSTSRGGLLAGKNRHGRSVIFADNWPDHARSWFPGIDHPSDKAAVQFRITAPEKFEVVANGKLAETRSLLDSRKVTRWTEDVPIPTYCMVFGAAEFSVEAAGEGSGVPLYLYSYPQDHETARRQFSESREILDYFAGLFGPFPYEKLAQVQSTTRFGGMENASAIFYLESLFAPGTAEAAPVAHEMAHQWFGDSVTPRDWDHLWLSEGFATYFSDLYAARKAGPEALRQRMEDHAQAVRKFHLERPGPIVDAKETDLSRKLNALNYEKGAWVLHMLRRSVGEEAFFGGIRSYCTAFANGSADSAGFQRIMEQASRRQLKVFFQQWLYRTGWPKITIAWNWNSAAREAEVSIIQNQKDEPYEFPLDLRFRSGERSQRTALMLSGRNVKEKVALEFVPEVLEVDPEGWLLMDVEIKK
jgi:aminopeptidase N